MVEIQYLVLNYLMLISKLRTVSGLTHGAINPVYTTFVFSNDKSTNKPGF